VTAFVSKRRLKTHLENPGSSQLFPIGLDGIQHHTVVMARMPIHSCSEVIESAARNGFSDTASFLLFPRAPVAGVNQEIGARLALRPLFDTSLASLFAIVSTLAVVRRLNPA
jgi:hypothetical protein